MIRFIDEVPQILCVTNNERQLVLEFFFFCGVGVLSKKAYYNEPIFLNNRNK